MKRVLIASLAVLAGCATVSGEGEDAADFRRSRAGPSSPRDDRVLLTQFNYVTGVAVSRRMVFVATEQGLGLLDRQFGNWLSPVTEADGYRSGHVSAVAADPVEDAVWVATPGSLLYYRSFVNSATNAIVPGVIDLIMFDRRDPSIGAYVRSSGTWLIASRSGSVSQVSPELLPPPSAREFPSTIQRVYAEFPQLETFSGLLTRDGDMQTWPVSAAARTPDVSEVWLGTRGNGVYKVDPLFNVANHFPFGLLEEGAGALAPAADGMWIGGLGRGIVRRSGLTFASTDLQRWRWLEGPLARPLTGARVYDLSVRGSSAWMATDRGVARMDTRNDNAFVMWNMASGLPSDDARALAVTEVGAWVGTSRGLVFVTDTGNQRAARRGVVSRTVAEGTAVRSLLLTGDTLWIGSDAGLLLLRAADSAPRRPAAAAIESRLTRPVRALARADSMVVVTTDNDIFRFSTNSGQLAARDATLDVGVVRGVTALAADAQTIWVAGLAGILVISRASGVSRFFGNTEIGGEAYDLQLDPDFAWIATSGGVLRLRRLADGTVR
ncbi:MAG: hypothetical protein ABR543_02335 [Gemmatimonadaceae bacterium]